MKIYIIVDSCSGEDYSADDVGLLLVTTNKDEAKVFFDNEISNWEDGMTDYQSNVADWGNLFVYECTDFSGDSHRIMKLIEKEVK